ncbi:flippase [Candidatus Gottesmanbacteria bacterium]|nr:flippase [Candidatus Gottesmanbacteria bacterium]
MGFKFKVAYNTLIQVAGRLFTGAVTYLITLVLVRQYGPIGFGEFIKILTFVSYFYIMADFGLNAVVVKQLEEKAKNQYVLGNLLGLRMVISLGLIFVAISLLAFLPQGVNQGFTAVVRIGIIIGSLTILTQSIITTTNAYFQKTLRYDKSVLAAALGYILSFLLAYLFARLEAPISLVALAYVLGGMLTVAVSFLLLPEKIMPQFDFSSWRVLFFKSLPLGLTLILNLVYFKADSFILTLLRSTEEVGVYGLAYKFFETTLVFPTFFMNSMYPVFLAKLKIRREDFMEVFKKSGVVLIFSSLLITLALYVFAPLLINFTSGPKSLDFIGATSALRVLSLSLPFFFISSFLMWFLITHDKQKTLVPIYALSMLLNIVLNLILIPKYGYIAAAATTLITEAFVTILLLIPSRSVLISQK